MENLRDGNAAAINRQLALMRDDGQNAAFYGNLDAESAEATLGIALQIFVQIRREIGAVWVQGSVLTWISVLRA